MLKFSKRWCDFPVVSSISMRNSGSSKLVIASSRAFMTRSAWFSSAWLVPRSALSTEIRLVHLSTQVRLVHWGFPRSSPCLRGLPCPLRVVHWGPPCPLNGTVRTLPSRQREFRTFCRDIRTSSNRQQCCWTVVVTAATVITCTSPPGDGRSIAISVSVFLFLYLSVCLFARLKNHKSKFQQTVCTVYMLPEVVAR